MKTIIIALALLICFGTSCFAQDFSNKGKDFWIAYGNHVRMFTGSPVERMQIYITSDVSTTGVVDIPSISFNQPYTVTANQITTIDIPRGAALLDEGQYNHGIHVTSVSPVVVYSFIYVSAVSGATLCLPTNVLGREYYSINYTQLSNETGASYSYFAVVATEDGTTVEITPSQTTKGGKQANVMFPVTLNKGQIYQVLSSSDLTGSIIKSVSSGTSGCKRIGVFSGSGKISIGCTNTAGSSDNLYQQAYPNNSWGKKYITTPSTNNATNFQTNFYRIIRPDPTSVVRLNGSIIPSSSFTNNFYYQFSGTTTNVISSDKAIMVAQYFTTSGAGPNCGNSGIGDPEMIYLNPVEQTISRVTLNSMQPAPANTALTTHFINAVLRNTPGGINTFKIDGVSYASRFSPVTQDATYAYARIPVAAQGHTITCDSGFNAISYGFGAAESYGYSAGTNVTDLYQFVTLQNPYATVNFPATCKGTPFKYSITLPYQPTSLFWDFGNNPNLSPNTAITNSSPIPDSTFVKDGKTLYVYKLPGDYTFSTAGTYNIKVTANNPTSDGCSGLQEIIYDIVVYNTPIADFTVTHNGCVTDSVRFSDATNGLGRPTTKWQWDFGDAAIDSVKNPVHRYLSAGTGSYSVKMVSYTDIGCRSEVTKTIPISSVPVVKFGVSDTTCIGKTISLTDSSTISVGTIVKWYWDYGNGIKDTLTTNAPRIVTYNTAGPYTISLKVESNTGCTEIYTKTITVHVNAVVDFSLPIVCLPVGTAQFNNLTTISDGTIATVTYKWDFGDLTTDVATNPLHYYTSTGPFNVKLVATSQFGCISEATKTLATVYAAPSANYTVSAEVCLRDSTSFTDASNPGSGNSITNWYWNRNFTGGASYIDTVQNFKYRYGVAGAYTSKMYFKTDKGCFSDTMTKTTIVNPLPISPFITSIPLCEMKDVLFTSQAVANAGNIVRWYWNMGNTITHNFTNGTAFNEVYTSVNNYTIKHIVETDKGCKSDTVTKNIYVNPLPQVGYILPEVCLADAAAVFTDTSKIADNSESQFTYLWTFNAATPAIVPAPTPATSTIKNGSTKYNKADNYSVSLKVTSKDGCTSELVKSFTVNGSIPVSDFAVLTPTALCSNLPVQIQNTSTVDFGVVTKVEIYWDYLNNPTVKLVDDTPTPNKIYSNTYADFQQPATKTFTIRFVAYSGGTCANIKTRTVTINASPKVQFTTMPGICLDATARQITQATETGGVAGASPAFMYYGTGISSLGIFTPSIAGVGTYPIKYVYTSDKGCKDSATQSITVWPSPTAVFGFSSPTCEKNDITFTDTSVANFGTLASWQWDFGNGATLTRTNLNPFTYKYTAASLTPYNVTLKVVTNNGCVSPAKTKPVTVNYLPVVSFSLPDICLPDGNGLFNDLSTIPDASQSLFTYRWDFGDANDPTPSTLKNATHKYTALAPSGGYQVKLKVTSKDGCVDSLTQAFSKVYPQPKANFSVIPNNGEVCLGDTLFFTDLSNGLTSPVNRWQWDFGDNTTSINQNPYKKYTDSGSFTVSLHIYNTQGCVSDTLKDTVIVHPYPKLDAGPDLFVLEGGTVQIKPIYYATNPHFLWSPSTYLNNDTIPNPNSTPLGDITYYVQLTGIGGCTDTASVFIKVLPKPIIPNAFSPNGDGINDTWTIEYLSSYPGATVEVFDRGGRLVFRSIGYSRDWNGKFNGEKLPVGTYYYIINPKNGRAIMSGNVTILK